VVGFLGKLGIIDGGASVVWLSQSTIWVCVIMAN
jgi:hypothetical protein